MPRYIDADAIHYVEIGKGVEIALASDIDKIPTVSPDEVRGVGEWIRLDVHKGMEQYKCSVCLTPVYVPECMGEPLYGFCPVCGARMKGSESEHTMDEFMYGQEMGNPVDGSL